MHMSVIIDTDEQEVRADAELRPVGGSLVVTVPKEIRDRLDLEPGDSLTFANAFDESTCEVRPNEEAEE